MRHIGCIQSTDPLCTIGLYAFETLAARFDRLGKFLSLVTVVTYPPFILLYRGQTVEHERIHPMTKNIFRATLFTLLLTAASWAQGNSAQAINHMMAAVQQKSGQTQSLIQQAQQSGNQQSLQVLQYESQMHQYMYQMLSQMQPLAAELDQNPQMLQQFQTVWREYDYRSTNHDWGQNRQGQPNYQQMQPYNAQPGYQQPGYQQPRHQAQPMMQQYPQQNGTFRNTTGGPAGQSLQGYNNQF